MNDQIEIKDLDQGVPVQADWLVFQKVSDGVVYKAPKSDIEGEDAFVYIGYADDDIGTGFTLTFNANKDYIAIKSTNTEIANPVVGDFAGLWKNYKGQKGATGDTGAKPISVAFSGNNMVFVLEDSSTITLTNAKIDLKGDKGDTGKGITSIVKTGTLGLVDTYTITYSDSTTSTFDVTNGAKGDKGDKGDIGPQGIQGIQGIQGNPGTNGIDGTDGISFTPKGAYNALTEYVANDVVSYLGSTWIALQTTTGNTPQESDYWTLNAAKGTDGAGSGDVLGPATNTANYIPQWDGANSKTLKNGLGLDTDLSSVSANDDTVPSAKATKTALDGKVPTSRTLTINGTALDLSADRSWTVTPSMTYKSGVTTYDLSTASGTQTIAHGLGKTPSKVTIKGLFFYYNNYQYLNISDGVYTSAGNTCIYGSNKERDSAYVSGNSTSFSIIFMPTNNTSTKQEGVITVDATNITITWTKTGSPTGTGQIIWTAE